MELIQKVDLLFFHLINHTWNHPILDTFFLIITKQQNWNLPLLIFIAYLLTWGGPTGRKIFLLLIPTIIFSDQISAHIFKPLVQRLRPCHPQHFIENGHFLLGHSVSYSFPSAHAANVFALATVISFKIPKWRYWFTSIAILIALSRIYVGVHYPLDVLFGAALGSFCAVNMLFVEAVLTHLPKKRLR